MNLSSIQNARPENQFDGERSDDNVTIIRLNSCSDELLRLLCSNARSFSDTRYSAFPSVHLLSLIIADSLSRNDISIFPVFPTVGRSRANKQS